VTWPFPDMGLRYMSTRISHKILIEVFSLVRRMEFQLSTWVLQLSLLQPCMMKYDFQSQNNQWTKIFKEGNKTTIFTLEITTNVTWWHATVQHTRDAYERGGEEKKKKHAEMYTLFHPLLHIQPLSTTLPVLSWQDWCKMMSSDWKQW
jgi:hypothetical protein